MSGACSSSAPSAWAKAVTWARPPDFTVSMVIRLARPPARRTHAQSLAAGAAGADPVTVLPAGGDAADCAEAAAAFAEIGARRLIVTKIDAARRFGGLLSAAQAGRFALMAASASPNISDPLMPFNPISLARLLLPAAADSNQRLPIREAS